MNRLDGYLVRYEVMVCFDSDVARTRYDHVGTIVRCTVCGEELMLGRQSRALVEHSRRHEEQKAHERAL